VSAEDARSPPVGYGSKKNLADLRCPSFLVISRTLSRELSARQQPEAFRPTPRRDRSAIRNGCGYHSPRRWGATSPPGRGPDQDSNDAPRRELAGRLRAGRSSPRARIGFEPRIECPGCAVSLAKIESWPSTTTTSRSPLLPGISQAQARVSAQQQLEASRAVDDREASATGLRIREDLRRGGKSFQLPEVLLRAVGISFGLPESDRTRSQRENTPRKECLRGHLRQVTAWSRPR
jgi:hypothetical protein